MKFLLMGPQGCGKGTQGEKLSQRLGLPLVSVGQLLRDTPPTSPYYDQIVSAQNSGKLVPNGVAAMILKEEISGSKYANGFIFDGWGRRQEDLDSFDPVFDKVIYINLSEASTLFRLSTRRTCNNCAKVYNISTMPPKVEGVCDVCGGQLIQREDDTEDAIKKRLEIFRTQTLPIIQKYKSDGKLIEVDGELTPDEVFEQIVQKLGL